MSTDAIDAVSLSIMWDRLVGITDEIISALARSSFSTIVRESGDLSVVVLDAQGNSMAQGSYSVPSFTGTAAPTLRHMLAKFPPDSLEPSDVIATNDAWMGTGHLFDINVMRPVFRNGRIAAYTMSITHLPDIGGLGFDAAATEIYHDRDVPGHEPRWTIDVHHLLLGRRVRRPSGSRRGGNHPGPVQHEDRADRDVGVADRYHHRAQAAASRYGLTRRGAGRSRSGDRVPQRYGLPAHRVLRRTAVRVSRARPLRRRRRKLTDHPDRWPCGASEGRAHGGPGTALHHARRRRRGLRYAGEPAAEEGAGRCRGGLRYTCRGARGVQRRRPVGRSRVPGAARKRLQPPPFESGPPPHPATSVPPESGWPGCAGGAASPSPGSPDSSAYRQ